MKPEEIHNIWLHMSGKSEGLLEAGSQADFPVLFANAILEYNKRQWQGLTDEEVKAPIQKAMQYFGYDSTQYSLGGAATIGFLGLVREIEAKLREKNDG